MIEFWLVQRLNPADVRVFVVSLILIYTVHSRCLCWSAFSVCVSLFCLLLFGRNPLIPAHNVLRAVSRAADRDAKHRQFLLRMQVRNLRCS